MANNTPILIQVKKLISDKQLRTLFYEAYVDGGIKHDSFYLNQFSPNRCPYCGGTNYSYKDKEKNGLYKYECNDCKKEFNLLTHTSLDKLVHPLHSYTFFLTDLINKKFNDSKALTKDKEYQYSIMFTNLSNILYKLSNLNTPFEGNNIKVHIFSYPDQVRDLTKLRNSNDLHNFILAILTDGTKVKIRIIGTGFINKRFLINKLSKLIRPGSTIIHSEANIFDDLIFKLNLKEEIIIGNKKEIQDSKELKEVFNLEKEFRNFLRYYDTTSTALFLDSFISTFELVERKNCEKEEKIAFLLSLLLNAYKLNDKEMFHYHKEQFDYQLSES